MAKLSKRTVDQAEAGEKDYFIWDDELPGFGLRVFKSGKRSYLLQYRAKGRTRRFTIGTHGVWTPDTVRVQACILLGRIADRALKVDNPIGLFAQTVLWHGATAQGQMKPTWSRY